MKEMLSFVAVCNRTVLYGGEQLTLGQSLCTEDGKYKAVLQHDGNFVLKTHNGTVKVGPHVL